MSLRAEQDSRDRNASLDNQQSKRFIGGKVVTTSAAVMLIGSTAAVIALVALFFVTPALLAPAGGLLLCIVPGTTLAGSGFTLFIVAITAFTAKRHRTAAVTDNTDSATLDAASERSGEEQETTDSTSETETGGQSNLISDTEEYSSGSNSEETDNEQNTTDSTPQTETGGQSNLISDTEKNSGGDSYPAKIAQDNTSAHKQLSNPNIEKIFQDFSLTSNPTTQTSSAHQKLPLPKIERNKTTLLLSGKQRSKQRKKIKHLRTDTPQTDVPQTPAQQGTNNDLSPISLNQLLTANTTSAGPTAEQMQATIAQRRAAFKTAQDMRNQQTIADAEKQAEALRMQLAETERQKTLLLNQTSDQSQSVIPADSVSSNTPLPATLIKNAEEATQALLLQAAAEEGVDISTLSQSDVATSSLEKESDAAMARRLQEEETAQAATSTTTTTTTSSATHTPTAKPQKTQKTQEPPTTTVADAIITAQQKTDAAKVLTKLKATTPPTIDPNQQSTNTTSGAIKNIGKQTSTSDQIETGESEESSEVETSESEVDEKDSFTPSEIMKLFAKPLITQLGTLLTKLHHASEYHLNDKNFQKEVADAKQRETNRQQKVTAYNKLNYLTKTMTNKPSSTPISMPTRKIISENKEIENAIKALLRLVEPIINDLTESISAFLPQITTKERQNLNHLAQLLRDHSDWNPTTKPLIDVDKIVNDMPNLKDNKIAEKILKIANPKKLVHNLMGRFDETSELKNPIKMIKNSIEKILIKGKKAPSITKPTSFIGIKGICYPAIWDVIIQEVKERVLIEMQNVIKKTPQTNPAYSTLINAYKAINNDDKYPPTEDDKKILRNLVDKVIYPLIETLYPMFYNIAFGEDGLANAGVDQTLFDKDNHIFNKIADELDELLKDEDNPVSLKAIFNKVTTEINYLDENIKLKT